MIFNNQHIKKVFLFSLILFCILKGNAQNCNLPVLSEIENESINGFTINWIDFNTNNVTWEIEYGIKGFVRIGMPQIDGISNTSYTLSGLSAGTSYELYIRTRCTELNVSDWNGPYFVNTVIDQKDACSLNLELSDNNCPSSDRFSIEVNLPGDPIIGENINIESVSLIISHPWPPDLKISLISPTGTEVLLSSHNGNGNDHYGDPNVADCEVVADFNLKSCISVADYEPPFVGGFLPEEDFVSNLNGEQVNGLWQISICDRANGDLGVLNHIGLNFIEESCSLPQNFSLFDVEDQTIRLTWDSFDDCESIKLSYQEVGAPPDDIFVDFVECEDESFIISELIPNTEYILTVSAECKAGLESEPLCSIPFVTSCSPSTFTSFFDDLQNCEPVCNTDCLIDDVWSNSFGSRRQWLIGEGSTTTSLTGPNGDKNQSGKYLFVESSTNCNSETLSIIESQCFLFNMSSECNLSFFYHMYGNETGRLSLEVSRDELTWERIWSLEGNQGNEWQYVELELDSEGLSKLRFVADIETGLSRSDIALDHIKIQNAQVGQLKSYFVDSDLDGFGVDSLVSVLCSSVAPLGYSTVSGDCDDTNSRINPDAQELPCNVEDENCNGVIDDGIIPDVEYTITIIEDEECQGKSNGKVLIENIMGSGPFNVFWFDGLNTNQREDLSEGIYFVTIEDSNGCLLESDPIIVNTTDVLVYNVNNIEDVSCDGFADGSIRLNVNGGEAPYNIIWSDGGTGLLNSNLSSGTYFATITSNNGCQIVTNEIVVTGNQEITTGVAIQGDVDCFGDSNGFIQLGILGGSPPYSVIWNTGDNTPFIENLEAGSYSVTIIDAVGCENTIDEIFVSSPDSLQVIVSSIDNVTCNGGDDSLVDITVLGGSPPYNYFWSNGIFNQDLIGQKAGLYDVTVTDFKACQYVLQNIEISEPSPISVDLERIDDVSCIGSETGLIDVSVSGGTFPYSYNWSNLDGMATGVAENSSLKAGDYFLTVVDQLGCKSERVSFEVINRNTPLNISLLQADSIICFNDSTSTIVAVSNNGILPLDFNWSTGDKVIKNIFSDTIMNLPAGKYNLTITDSEGCVGISDSINVLNVAEIQYAVDEIAINECNGDRDGVIELNGTGGDGSLEYVWNNGTISNRNADLENGLYRATISDTKGCSIVTEDFIISSTDTLLISADITNDNGSGNGQIIINVDRGEQPISFSWGNMANDFILSNLSHGDYPITITDSNGCSIDTVFTVDFISSTIENENEEFHFFPNPASRIIELKTGNAISEIAEVNFYGMDGIKVVSKITIIDNRIAFDLASGVYFVELISRGKRWVKPLVVIN